MTDLVVIKRQMTPAQQQARNERTQARVGLASNAVGLGAGIFGTRDALRHFQRVRRTKTGEMLHEAPRRISRKTKIAAGALLGLQVANVGGDIVANRVLARSAKDPASKALVHTNASRERTGQHRRRAATVAGLGAAAAVGGLTARRSYRVLPMLEEEAGHRFTRGQRHGIAIGSGAMLAAPASLAAAGTANLTHRVVVGRGRKEPASKALKPQHLAALRRVSEGSASRRERAYATSRLSRHGAGRGYRMSSDNTADRRIIDSTEQHLDRLRDSVPPPGGTRSSGRGPDRWTRRASVEYDVRERRLSKSLPSIELGHVSSGGSDHSFDGHGTSLVSKVGRRFDPEADRQRRLGLYAGTGVGGSAVLGHLASREFEGKIDRKGKYARLSVKAGRSGRRGAALAGLSALSGGAGIAAYRRGVTERNQPWN